MNLWLSIRDGSWSSNIAMPAVRDYKAILQALEALWGDASKAVAKNMTMFRVGIILYSLTPASERQLDFLLSDDHERRKQEAVTRCHGQA